MKTNQIKVYFFIFVILVFIFGGFYLMKKSEKLKNVVDKKVTEVKDTDIRLDKTKDYIYYSDVNVVEGELDIEYKNININFEDKEGVAAIVNKENEEISNQKALEEQLEREKYKAQVKTEKKKINKPRPKLAKNKIEEKLARLERDLSVKHSYLDLPEYYQNSQKMNELSQEISSLEKEYESLIDELSLYDED